jgi:hypothetical protein
VDNSEVACVELNQKTAGCFLLLLLTVADPDTPDLLLMDKTVVGVG